jgi:thiamine pyrophosphate-dependent acetolactate synthase large subunit-like protein
MAVVSGAQLIARTLRDLGVTVVFGIGKILSKIILF